MARTWLLTTSAVTPGPKEFQQAAGTIEALSLDGMDRHRLSAEVQHVALDLLQAHRMPSNPSVHLFGQPLQEVGLRKGIESALRGMAHLATTEEEKVHFVDMANQVRPTTLL